MLEKPSRHIHYFVVLLCEVSLIMSLCEGQGSLFVFFVMSLETCYSLGIGAPASSKQPNKIAYSNGVFLQ